MPTLDRPAKNTPASPFTRRELDVASWLGEDVTYAEIAKQLGISRETVRAHLRNIGKKLGVRSRHAIVARLLVHGFLPSQPGNGSAEF